MSAIKAHAKFFELISHHWPHQVEPAPTPEEAGLRRRHRVENLIRFCWALIMVKSFVVVWLVHRYDIPFNPLWVVGPTVVFACLATAVYYIWRD